MRHIHQVNFAVIGAGPAGLAAGLAAAQLGLDTAVIGPLADPGDGRTAALFESSVGLLRNIGAWELAAAEAERLDAIRIVDATGSLLRTPEVTFRAAEIGLKSFGHNIANAKLAAALEQASVGRLRRILTAGVISVEANGSAVRVTTSEGGIVEAPLVAGADGRNSLVRRCAGIDTKTWSYEQAAVVCTFSHTRPHHNVSTELHRRSGPLTVVPMRGQMSSLVWVDTPQEAERLQDLPEAAFVAELSRHLAGLLGTISNPSQRRAFPLSGLTADTLAKNRMALIGEAGHVMPPIGAQGLNLSLRDAATLAELASDAHTRGEDIGSDSVLAAYEKARRADVASRQWGIDLMNRSLISEFAPIHLARGAGLVALKSFAPLRQLVMREGVSPSFATPRLMRTDNAFRALDAAPRLPASPGAGNVSEGP